MQITEQLKDAQDASRKSRYSAERAAIAARQQVIILKSAQKGQVDEFQKLLEDIKAAMNEGLFEPTEKSEAVEQLSETIARYRIAYFKQITIFSLLTNRRSIFRLSAEKRALFERAENAEFNLSQAQADLANITVTFVVVGLTLH